jgi:cytochrome c553
MKDKLLMAAIVMSLGIASAAQAAGDPQAGKAKTGTCAGCHGANGEGVGSNPPLAGLKEDQIIQAIKDYQSGKRVNATMKAMTKSLNEQDMANIGAYYASLKKK